MTDSVTRSSTPPASPTPAPLPVANTATLMEEIHERADTVWTRGGKSGKPRITGARLGTQGNRVAVVDGARTPFCKASTVYKAMDVVDLASVAAAELVARAPIDPTEIDQSVFGVVIPALYAPNLGREVILRNSLPRTIPGTTVNLACASSNRAICFGAQAILSGEADVVVAGGAESLSSVPITYSKRAAQILMRLSKAKSLPAKLKALSSVKLRDLAPVAPAIAEFTTGQSMGQSAEKMAKENDISRQSQDEIALMSHQRAAAAVADGRFERQIVATFPRPRYDTAITADNGVRSDTSMEALAGLRPVFDKRYGTLSAGNSSPLTDGGSAVLLMSEERVKALGIEPLGYLRSFAFAALDPATQLLQGPAWAAPRALELAGAKLADLDLIEMHEAFAAQIVSNLKAFASPKFAREELGVDEPLGAVDLERYNVNGGSISIGHPFGATGARVTLQLLHEMKRRDVNLGMMTVCAAGGVGFAMVVER